MGMHVDGKSGRRSHPPEMSRQPKMLLRRMVDQRNLRKPIETWQTVRKRECGGEADVGPDRGGLDDE